MSTRRLWRVPSWTQEARSNDKKSAVKPSRESLGRSRGGLTSKIHLAADTRCRPISRVTSAGHRHDLLAFEPVMAGIRIRRSGRGRPRTRPGRVLGDKAYSSRAIRCHLRRRRIKATIPEPADQRANRLRRGSSGGAATGVRRRAVQAAQRGRTGDQQAQGPLGGRHSLRQTRLHVPRNHRRRLDPDLAPRPRPMIRGTGSSAHLRGRRVRVASSSRNCWFSSAGDKSLVTGKGHARICRSRRVKLPPATRPVYGADQELYLKVSH